MLDLHLLEIMPQSIQRLGRTHKLFNSTEMPFLKKICHEKLMTASYSGIWRSASVSWSVGGYVYNVQTKQCLLESEG